MKCDSRNTFFLFFEKPLQTSFFFTKGEKKLFKDLQIDLQMNFPTWRVYKLISLIDKSTNTQVQINQLWEKKDARVCKVTVI